MYEVVMWYLLCSRFQTHCCSVENKNNEHRSESSKNFLILYLYLFRLQSSLPPRIRCQATAKPLAICGRFLVGRPTRPN